MYLGATTKQAATANAEEFRDAGADLVNSNPFILKRSSFSEVIITVDETILLAVYQRLKILVLRSQCIENLPFWREQNRTAKGTYHSYESQHAHSQYFNWVKNSQLSKMGYPSVESVRNDTFS